MLSNGTWGGRGRLTFLVQIEVVGSFVHVVAQSCRKQGSSREQTSCVPGKPGFEAVLC